MNNNTLIIRKSEAIELLLTKGVVIMDYYNNKQLSDVLYAIRSNENQEYILIVDDKHKKTENQIWKH